MENSRKARLEDIKQLSLVVTIFSLFAATMGGFSSLVIFNKAGFCEVIPQKVYRSGQPIPQQLQEWIRKYGIKTVINLRGDARSVTRAEQKVTDKSGAQMITMDFVTHSLPSKAALSKLIYTIETAEQPILIHCRRGIDRSGLASALASMAIGKTDYKTAKWQAYVPPGPWKRMENSNYVHISDVFILYEKYCANENLDCNNWQQFKKWVTDTKLLDETKHTKPILRPGTEDAAQSPSSVTDPH